MFHALLLTAETFEELAADGSAAAAARESIEAGARPNAIFLPQFAAALPLFIRARAMVQDLNTHHAPAGANHEGENMNTTKPGTTFNRSIYRDFALFALAAVGVGLAISLTLATAVVLAAPSEDSTIKERSAAGPRITRTQLATGADAMSIRHPQPGIQAPGQSPS